MMTMMKRKRMGDMIDDLLPREDIFLETEKCHDV